MSSCGDCHELWLLTWKWTSRESSIPYQDWANAISLMCAPCVPSGQVSKRVTNQHRCRAQASWIDVIDHLIGLGGGERRAWAQPANSRRSEKRPEFILGLCDPAQKTAWFFSIFFTSFPPAEDNSTSRDERLILTTTEFTSPPPPSVYV
jgi:hypothetical protein